MGAVELIHNSLRNQSWDEELRKRAMAEIQIYYLIIDAVLKLAIDEKLSAPNSKLIWFSNCPYKCEETPPQKLTWLPNAKLYINN